MPTFPTKRFPRSTDRVNLQHPLCRGLRFCTFLDTAYPRNMIPFRTMHGTPVNSPTLVGTPFGTATQFVRGSSQRIDFDDGGKVVGDLIDVSVLIFARCESMTNNTYSRMMGAWDGTHGWTQDLTYFSGSGIAGTQLATTSHSNFTVGGTAAWNSTWQWYCGRVRGVAVPHQIRSYLGRLIGTDTNEAVTSRLTTAKSLGIGGDSGDASAYFSGQIAFAAVFETALTDAEIFRWQEMQWDMFRPHEFAIATFPVENDDGGATAEDTLIVQATGPMELDDGGIEAEVEGGGSVSTTPPYSGPVELSDEATATTGTTTVGNPTTLAFSESSSAASTLSIPNPLELSDNAFARSKARTILNSNPGILAEGRYRR